MATSSTLCGPCSERHITKPSVHWCSECEVSICDDCQELHNVLKATRSHEFIPIAKYESLSSFITDIQQSCNYHNEKYQQYCVAHALPICFKCSKEHQKCNVIPLDEVTNNAKTSGHFQDLETRLIDLLHNIDIIKKDRKANLVSIAERKEIHLEEIQHIRNQINEQLDKLEKDIKQDIEKNICQCKQSIQSILLTVKEKENLIIEYQTTLQLTKQHASDLQTFLVMRDIKVKVLENEQYLQSLVETNKFETVDLVFKVYPEVNSILNSMKLFGSIEIKKKSSIICLIRADDRQAQLQVTPARTINDLKLILKKKITTDGEHITSCCMSVKGEYFFTDYYSKKLLSVTASDGTFKFNILLDPSYRFDITLIDEKTIAITSGDYDKHKGIDIINTESRKKIKFISLPGCAWGITRDQDALFVCVETRGIYTVSTVNYTTSHVIRYNLSSGSYVSVFNDKIYFTDWCENSVVCCDRYGSHVWTYRNKSVLGVPNGIAVDNYGNVFVAGRTPSNVVIISNDGKLHRQVLTKEDGLCVPYAIFFNKQTRKLLVANEEKIAFLYSVT
ncbi:Hypothetical predicted protein [Mytilus galloprovincialis]|uniref:B box-type domain-containing protein n=1 Tax=Mytilus galloprovincialis TaxID=29158 RepID=A0A8B6D2Y4_MYTGA|nr:Hypothetical predicted protein [Mytilus galloprovincialis]